MLTRLALILVCGLGLTACGSSSPGNQTSDPPTKGYSQALAFSKCMRAHGVSNFPDPSTSGGGIHIQVNAATGQVPAFQSAQQACRHLLPGAGPSSPAAAAQARAQLLQISECMRAHGISGFPDPTSSPPASPGANSAVLSRNGATLVIPASIDTRSPAFRQAAAACNFGLRPGVVAKR